MPAPHPRMHGLTHVTGGPDPIPGLQNIPDPSGSDLDDLILAAGPDAFWKLNESSGTVAHDSSGNGHDLTTAGGYTAPTWGQPAGPPGDTTAKWVDGTTRVSGTLTGFTDNFTAGVWIRVHTDLGTEIMGQGAGGYHGTIGGWAILKASGKFAVGTNATVFYANSAFSLDTWYFVAVVRDAGTWKLYVNGLLQAATSSTSPATVDGTNTWLGNDAWASHTSYLQDALLSYAFIANSVLTGTDLLAIYNTGVSGGLLAAGLVWTADGSGGASWQPNLETIAKTGSTPLTGDVTLTAGSNVTLTQAGQDITIAASGGGGGGGAWTLLSTTTLSSPGPFDVSSISGSYNDLICVVISRGTYASDFDDLAWHFNNDTGSNYCTQLARANSTTVVGQRTNNLTSLFAGTTVGSTGLANSFGVCQLTVYGYASTTWLKALQFNSFRAAQASDSNVDALAGGGLWKSTAAVTRVQVTGNADLAAGSQLRIYGRL